MYHLLKKSALFVSLFFSTAPMLGVIPYASKYQLGDTECYLLYDLHVDVKKSKVSKKQVESLQAMAKEFGLAFIVEDMFSYEGSDESVGAYIACVRQVAETDVLLFSSLLSADLVEYSGLYNFTKKAKEQGINVINCEYRQPDFLMNAYLRNGNSFEANITLEKFKKIFAEKLEQVRQFRDGEQLEQYYREVINKVEAALTYLNEKALNPSTPEGNVKYREAYLTCSCELLEAHVVHTTVTQLKTHQKVAVFLGGYHTEKVAKILELLGYTKTSEQGDKSFLPFWGKFGKNLTKENLKMQSFSPLTCLSGMWNLYCLQSACIKKCFAMIKKADAIDFRGLFSVN